MGGSQAVLRSGDAPPTVELERPSRGRDAQGNLGRVRLVPGDRREAQLRRRAKQQGLALMLASTAVSLLILYGAWLLLRGTL
jgi:hypothetical protein